MVIEAVSFQDESLTYQFVAMDTASQGVFIINGNSGQVTLNRALVSIRDPAQYRMRVEAREGTTGEAEQVQVLLQ